MYAKVGDLNAHGNIKYLLNSHNYISDEVLAAISATPFSEGSIVFPRVGAALRANNKRILNEDSVVDDNVLVVTVKNNQICWPEYLYYWFEYHDLQEFCNDGSVPVIGATYLKKQKVVLPELTVQKTEAAILSTWDVCIEKQSRLIAARELYYSYERFRLLTRSGYPHLKVGTFAHEVSTRNRLGDNERVLSVTNNRGFVLPKDQFRRRVASEDVSNYKVVTRGQYAYNPSRLNVGSIARLDGWKSGVLSPMYVVFELDETKSDSDYFFHWLGSSQARQRISSSAQGTVRETVSFSDFSLVTVPLPSIGRQVAISRYLNSLRNEISIVRAQLSKLKQQKRGLMQKLLTGQWQLALPESAIA